MRRHAFTIALGAASAAIVTSVATVGCVGGEGAAPTSDAATRPSRGGGEEATCGAPTTCEGARRLGTISGDSDAGTLTAQGTTSTWVLAQVTEDENGWSGRPMRIRATLTPPPGATYELYAYGSTAERLADGGILADAGRLVDCTTLAARGAERGEAVHLDLAWGEALDGGAANGLEDGRTLAFEVRHVEGTCSPEARWSLVVSR